MSLINDALRRAKEAHQQTPVPPPDLPFRPVEPGQQCARRGLGLLLPVALLVVALLVLLLGWQWAQRRRAPTPVEAAARTAPAAGNRAEALPTPAKLGAAAAVPALPPQHQAPALVGAATPAADTAPGASNVAVADAQDSEATNAALAVAPEPPKPAPLRLQAILFNPKRPSAIISGKTVFIGDRVGVLRVASIDQECAVLTGPSQTNVLSLAQ